MSIEDTMIGCKWKKLIKESEILEKYAGDVYVGNKKDTLVM